jgi:Sortilin, neurotensin receptor 3, C-terminal
VVRRPASAFFPFSSPRPFLLTFVEFHSDFNFIRQGDDCIAVGPEPVPAGVCNADNPNQMYKGSSGWRKVPGNTCVGGVRKDEKVDKKCSMGRFHVHLQYL